MDNASIDRAKEHFGQIVEEQLKRVEEMKKPVEWVDYAQTRPIIIGILDKGLNQAGVHYSLQYIVKGSVILTAVYLDVRRR